MIQQYVEENASLKKENAALKKENAALKKEMAALKKEMAALKKEMAALKENATFSFFSALKRNVLEFATSEFFKFIIKIIGILVVSLLVWLNELTLGPLLPNFESMASSNKVNACLIEYIPTLPGIPFMNKIIQTPGILIPGTTGIYIPWEGYKKI